MVRLFAAAALALILAALAADFFVVKKLRLSLSMQFPAESQLEAWVLIKQMKNLKSRKVVQPNKIGSNLQESLADLSARQNLVHTFAGNQFAYRKKNE